MTFAAHPMVVAVTLGLLSPSVLEDIEEAPASRATTGAELPDDVEGWLAIAPAPDTERDRVAALYAQVSDRW